MTGPKRQRIRTERLPEIPKGVKPEDVRGIAEERIGTARSTGRDPMLPEGAEPLPPAFRR